MRLVHGEGDEPVLVEDGHDDHHVGEVRATTAIGAVGHEGVTRAYIAGFRVMLEKILYSGVEGGQEGGHAIPLRQQVAARVGGTNGEVGGFVNDWAHARAYHRFEHFVAHRNYAVLDDLKVECCRAHGVSLRVVKVE